MVTGFRFVDVVAASYLNCRELSGAEVNRPREGTPPPPDRCVLLLELRDCRGELI